MILHDQGPHQPKSPCPEQESALHYSAQRAHKIETTLAVARAPEAPSAPAWPGLEEDACRVLKAHVAVAWFLARRPQLDLSGPHISHDQRTLWRWRHPSGVIKRRSNTLWICLPSRKRGIAQHISSCRTALQRSCAVVAARSAVAAARSTAPTGLS